MTTRVGVRRCALAAALAWAGAAAAATLEFADAEGRALLACTLEPQDRWCLVWNHSVAGFAVRDCFVYRPPAMILDESHQPDFAAGLGHVPGRGELRSDADGGYRIVDIAAPVAGNELALRVGSPRVNHRVEFPGAEAVSLSERAAGERLVMRVSHGGRGLARPSRRCDGG